MELHSKPAIKGNDSDSATTDNWRNIAISLTTVFEEDLATCGRPELSP